MNNKRTSRGKKRNNHSDNRMTMPLEQAVERSVEDCIREGILKEFLLKNKAKVVSMSIFEYDDEQKVYERAFSAF